MTLRAKRLAALRTRLHAGHMLLNLRGHDLLLQACKQRFALCYSQSHASRRDFLPPLDHPHLVFDGAAWDRLKYQLDCPFHPQRLTQPTTLHTLFESLWEVYARLLFASREGPAIRLD